MKMEKLKVIDKKTVRIIFPKGKEQYKYIMKNTYYNIEKLQKIEDLDCFFNKKIPNSYFEFKTKKENSYYIMAKRLKKICDNYKIYGILEEIF